MYPYLPPHIARPKELRRLFLVALPERCYLSVRRTLLGCERAVNLSCIVMPWWPVLVPQSATSRCAASSVAAAGVGGWHRLSATPT